MRGSVCCDVLPFQWARQRQQGQGLGICMWAVGLSHCDPNPHQGVRFLGGTPGLGQCGDLGGQRANNMDGVCFLWRVGWWLVHSGFELPKPGPGYKWLVGRRPLLPTSSRT